MAMTPEEKYRLSLLERQVRELEDTVETNKQNIAAVEGSLNRILNILTGIKWGGIAGIILTLLLLGYLTLRDVLSKV